MSQPNNTKPAYHLVSFSGGKDSTAMLLRMLEAGMPVDEILYCDTGMDFPQMYEHLDRVERCIGRPITKLSAPYSFLEYFHAYTPRTTASTIPDRGLSWPDRNCRWCTGRMKTHVIDRHLRGLRQQYQLEQYVGIAADEAGRCKDLHYPLVEWGMTEADCLAYCKARGFDWGGLYDIFRRVSCWCCPLQPLSELRELRRHFPDLWKQLLFMDAHTWRAFRPDYTARQLELRFQYEDLCKARGMPLTGKAFYSGMRDYFAAHGAARTAPGRGAQYRLQEPSR